MEKLTRGQLRVITADKVYNFGTPSIYSQQYPNPTGQPYNAATDSIKAEITVVNETFWVRMLLLSDLGFSEAYMTGDIEVDNLDNLFKVSHELSSKIERGIDFNLAIYFESIGVRRIINRSDWNNL